MTAFDENLARKLEQMYLAPSVVARRRSALDVLDLHPGQSGLDIGTGPGFLACEMAERVGSAGRVAAIDASAAVLDFARRRGEQVGVAKWTDFQEADAAALPFPDASFDGAIALQVFEFVPEVEQALREAHRVLRPGGRLVAIDSDWTTLVWHTDDGDLMTRMRQALLHAGHFADSTLPRKLSPFLRRAGFDNVMVTPVPLLETRFDTESYSYHALDIITNLARDHEGFTSEHADALIADVKKQAADDRYWFSLSQYLFVANKPI